MRSCIKVVARRVDGSVGTTTPGNVRARKAGVSDRGRGVWNEARAAKGTSVFHEPDPPTLTAESKITSSDGKSRCSVSFPPRRPGSPSAFTANSFARQTENSESLPSYPGCRVHPLDDSEDVSVPNIPHTRSPFLPNVRAIYFPAF